MHRRTATRLALGLVCLVSLVPLCILPPVSGAEIDFYGREGLPVAFNVTVEPGGPVDSWRWDFDGDGTDDWRSTSGPNATHTFDSPGTFSSVLYADLANGTTGSWIFRVRVAPSNSPPIVTITSGSEGYMVTDRKALVAFSGAALDVDGSVVLYEWDFEGDGTFDWSSAAGAATSHLYSELGNFSAVLRATDDGGATGTASIWIEVRNIAPWVRGKNLTTWSPTTSMRVDTYDKDGTVVNLTWDLGDGTPPLRGGVGELEHTFLGPGTYYVTVVAEDNDGGTSSTTFWVWVKGDGVLYPPSVDAGGDKEAVVGQEVRFQAVASPGSAPIELYHWDLDGDDMLDAEGESVSFTYGEAGTYQAYVVVKDMNDLVAKDTFTVTVHPVVNLKPVPRPSVEQWVRPGRNLHFRQESHDPDGRIVLYRWDFDGDGTFDYSNSTTGNTTHVYPEEGVYVAVLQVTDNRGEVASATVSVKVSRDAPGEDEVDDSKGAAVCCGITAVVLILAAYWAMRRSMATPRKDMLETPREAEREAEGEVEDKEVPPQPREVGTGAIEDSHADNDALDGTDGKPRPPSGD